MIVGCDQAGAISTAVGYSTMFFAYLVYLERKIISFEMVRYMRNQGEKSRVKVQNIDRSYFFERGRPTISYYGSMN